MFAAIIKYLNAHAVSMKLSSLRLIIIIIISIVIIIIIIIIIIMNERYCLLLHPHAVSMDG